MRAGRPIVFFFLFSSVVHVYSIPGKLKIYCSSERLAYYIIVAINTRFDSSPIPNSIPPTERTLVRSEFGFLYYFHYNFIGFFFLSRNFKKKLSFEFPITDALARLYGARQALIPPQIFFDYFI